MLTIDNIFYKRVNYKLRHWMIQDFPVRKAEFNEDRNYRRYGHDWFGIDRSIVDSV
jgi:hypothetical protein